MVVNASGSMLGGFTLLVAVYSTATTVSIEMALLVVQPCSVDSFLAQPGAHIYIASQLNTLHWSQCYAVW